MPPTRAAKASSGGKASLAAVVQTAFRDVTNSYLNANKENIPPGYLSSVNGAAALGGDHRSDGSGACNPNACGVSRGRLLRDADFCYTPLQTDLARTEIEYASDAATCVMRGPGAGATLVTGSAGAARGTPTPVTPKGRSVSSCAAAAGNTGDGSGLAGVLRTPGHNTVQHPALSNGNAACRLIPQRHHALSSPHTADTSAVSATPHQSRQRSSCGVRATPLPSPMYASWNRVAAATSTPASGMQGDGGGGSQPSSQPSILSTPNGACRSCVAAEATVAAVGTRAPLDTPVRPEEIPLFFNNSFESGSESPTGDAVASGGRGAALTTPYRTCHLQMAVEEMLRNCLDSFTPTKGSDASGATPCGSWRRRQQRQAAGAHASPLNAYAALESLLPPGMGVAGRSGSDAWAPAMMGSSTPGRLTALQGAFAESDSEDASATPLSDRASSGMPSAGVRRDPMVYFSTTAVAASKSSESWCEVARSNEADAESLSNAIAGCGACRGAAESLSQHSSDTRSAFEYNCSDGSCNGPDVLAMLAAAVQQQYAQSSRRSSEARPQSAYSRVGSVESGSHALSERNVATASQQQQQSTTPPPSYDDAARHQKPLRLSGHTHLDFSASSCATAPHALPPTRRSHHLPHVKAAAGSLIAVGGRRVPVDKLHLLSINDEPSLSAISPTAGRAAAMGSSRGGPKARSQPSSSSAPHHVEGPSMRRVPKASLVTVTRAAATDADAAAPVATSSRASVPDNRSGAPLPTSSSSNVSEAAVARAVAAGPSARRLPPAMATQQRHSSGDAIAGVAALSSAVNQEGAQQSSEADVVAVLRFSKGQTMRFLTNLSSAALATARRAVTRGRSSARRTTACTATPVLASRMLLSSVQVGKTYLAHVYAEGSPHEGLSYEDAGVCVQLITPASSNYAAQLNCVDGVLLRTVEVFSNEEDRKQHERVLLQQTTAYIECERQFKFSSLPFQLESIYFTFDGSVCVVFYRVVAAADGSLSSTSHRHTNTSRVVRELQLHLNCRVVLKQC
ncbi:hypothetical protein LSCM1_03761 [Leishmania martiniquensis]|uniref:PSP1 C-terminal domain-containing protein n=1 Tax=Leishmania martiniquensis TaxID=1580590 RepID=A0A836FZS7_9TRYP|nr:hypothetical protein LSCM1_03761 [Leishmania martiniquensis]